ncbi:hypothetical protein [Nonomuraea dietziae]|uniref:hypothetical protein n=1 Tax=Nonomuraea dietziae TaxID=65515 RepID=UPI00343CE820
MTEALSVGLPVLAVGAFIAYIVIRYVIRAVKAEAHGRPQYDPECCDCAEVIEQLEEQRRNDQRRVRQLETELATARAEIERLTREPEAPADVAELLATIDTLQERNADVMATHGSQEALLRERETSRHLANEVHRLTLASIAMDEAIARAQDDPAIDCDATPEQLVDRLAKAAEHWRAPADAELGRS